MHSEGGTSPEMVVRSSKFCPQLTSARFFAAAAVVLYHYQDEVAPLSTSGLGSPLRNLLERGFVGVTFFFVLSGYILSLNYLEKFKSREMDIKGFFVARFARIYPLYIVSVLVCIPYVFFDPAKIPHGEDIINLRSHPVSAAVMYLLGAESHWPDNVGRLTVLPTWSISTEFFFYLLFPLFALVTSRLTRTQAKLGMLIVGSWALAYSLLFHFVRLSDILFFLHPNQSQVINDFIFQRPVSGIHANWPIFAIGMLTFRAFDGQLSPEVKMWLPRVVVFFLIANSIWYVLQPKELQIGLFFLTKYFDALPLFTMGILWLHKGSGKIHTWLGNPKQVLLGEISFALYLVHSPVRLAARFLIARPLGLIEASPMFFIPCWIVSLALSWVAWKYIEVPARTAILGAWKRRQERRRALAV